MLQMNRYMDANEQKMWYVTNVLSDYSTSCTNSQILLSCITESEILVPKLKQNEINVYVLDIHYSFIVQGKRLKHLFKFF